MNPIQRIGYRILHSLWKRHGLLRSAMGKHYRRYPRLHSQDIDGWMETFNQASKINSPVSMIATDISAINGKLYTQKSDGEEEELLDHPFLDFWNQPSPFPEWTREEMIKALFISYFITGEGYIRIHNDSGMLYLAFVETRNVLETPYQGRLEYVIQDGNGVLEYVPMGEIFVIKNINPADAYGRGIGLIYSLSREIETSLHMSDYQNTFFENDATPPHIVDIPGATKDQLDRFKAEFLGEHKGSHNHHKIAFTASNPQFPLSVNKLGETMKDLDMIEGTKSKRDELLESLHIPREMLGITENSNRATADAAMFIYADRVLKPLVTTKLQNAVNAVLTPMFGDNIEYRFDDVVPHNAEFNKTLATEGWSACLLTLNEARELLGKPLLDENLGNVLRSDILFAYVDADQKLSDIETTPPAADEWFFGENTDLVEKRLGFKAGRVDEAFIKRQERLVKEKAKHGGKAINQYFKTQRKIIVDAINSTRSTKSANDKEVNYDSLVANLSGMDEDQINSSPLISDFVSQMLDWNKDENLLLSKLNNIWEESYTAGADSVLEVYRFNEPYRPLVNQAAANNAAEKIRGISDATKNDINRLVTQNLIDGGSKDELTKAVNDSSGLGATRADTIAYQEVKNSMEAANYQTYKNCGIKEKVWHSKGRGTGNRRAEHLRMNGERVPIDSLFSNGLMHPGDPQRGTAEDNIHCQCIVLPGR